jgi:glycogen phosphorylase
MRNNAPATKLNTDPSVGLRGISAEVLGAPAADALDCGAYRQAVLEHLLCTCAKDACDADAIDLYRAMAHAVRDRLVHRWLDTQRTYYEHDVKYLYYLSSEFLTGRSLGLSLLNMGLYGVAERIAAEREFDLGDVLECELDPGLGNGGLGRLAACFMDSLATLALPALGYGIRYEYGMFEQTIEDGQQVEQRDRWLRQGNPWELAKYEHAQTVKFYGHVEQRCDAAGRPLSEWVAAKEVIGIPYDSFVVGHAADNVNTLRLWAARTVNELDLSLFDRGDYLHAVAEKIEVENISRVLYPNDTTPEGKELRLKQQYFFVACSIGDIVRRFKQTGHPWEKLPERAAIQLNDTHPAIAVAELMRVLVDEEALDWERAFELASATFGYTNHTLLAEALECWPVELFERLLPRHLTIIYELNQRFLALVAERFPGDAERQRRMSLIEEGETKRIRMAHLATLGSHSINGVAKLHSQLVKEELLHDFFELWPERFNNKTNGITPRRWLLYANPALARLLTRRLGPDWLPHELERLSELTSRGARGVPLARIVDPRWKFSP